MPSSDFKPFATGPGALVLTPAVLAQATWLNGGFNGGIADVASMNTLWRQGNFVAAGITQWMANVLNRNIFDDGNLNNFISLFGSALTAGSGGGVSSFNSRTGAVTLLFTDVTNALGYTPVKSFGGPGGTPRSGVVTLQASDINQAEGYTPLNRGGDTMTGYLSGPEPATSNNYATKNYVDRAVAGAVTSGVSVNAISAYSSEWDFPLPFGGIMKVGQWVTGFFGGSPQQGFIPPTNTAPTSGLIGFFQSPGTMQPGISYQINFATPFPSVCAGVTLETLGNDSGRNNIALAAQPTTTGFSTWAICRAWNFSSQQEQIPLPGFPCQVLGFLWFALGF